MKKLTDCFGREVRLTAERLAHILEHPEMKEMTGAIDWVITQPQIVRKSNTGASARLFYEFHSDTIVGGKWLCVVVKYNETDAFVFTAYLTDKVKSGEDLWPKR